MASTFPTFLKIVTLDKTPNTRSQIILGLIKLLSEALHFSYEVVYSEDGQIGQHLGGSNWTGMIGMLQREDCDMSADPIAVTESRQQAVMFSYPYEIAEVTFATNKLRDKPKSFAIIQPFSVYVWIALAVSFFGASFLFHAISHRKYVDVFFTLFGNLLSQATKSTPKELSTKLLMAVWMAGVFFLIVSYQATLLSCLSFPSQEGVRNLEDLSKAVTKGTHRCLTRKGSFMANYLLKSSDESLRAIGKSLQDHGSLSMTEEEFLNSGRGAYISSKQLLMHLQEKFFLSDDPLAYSLVSVALRKSFCCKSLLDRAIRRITEAGLYGKNVDETIFSAILNGRSKNIETVYNRQLSMEDLMGAFIFLIVGYVFGILIFFIEIISKRCSDLRMRRSKDNLR